MLTKLQSAVAELMALGATDAEIRKQLHLSSASLSQLRATEESLKPWTPQDEKPDEQPLIDGKLPPDTRRYCPSCDNDWEHCGCPDN